MNLNKIIALILIIGTFTTTLYAEEYSAPMLAKNSLLYMPPYKKEWYKQNPKSLTRKEYWKLKIHGIRDSALHPDFWGIRIIDRTDNRALVPIRPFYLRASELEDFRAKKISIDFSFQGTNLDTMKRAPHLHEPVFEVGFAGKFKQGIKGEREILDRGYLLRLSGAPNFESGIWYRSHTKRILIEPASKKRIETKKVYKLEIQFKKDSVVAKLDGKVFSKIKGKDLDQGFISLITGWHPAYLRKLEVEGTIQKDGQEILIKHSGLVPL